MLKFIVINQTSKQKNRKIEWKINIERYIVNKKNDSHKEIAIKFIHVYMQSGMRKRHKMKKEHNSLKNML